MYVYLTSQTSIIVCVGPEGPELHRTWVTGSQALEPSISPAGPHHVQGCALAASQGEVRRRAQALGLGCSVPLHRSPALQHLPEDPSCAGADWGEQGLPRVAPRSLASPQTAPPLPTAQMGWPGNPRGVDRELLSNQEARGLRVGPSWQHWNGPALTFSRGPSQTVTASWMCGGWRLPPASSGLQPMT